jgi:hypothetical protein
MRASEVHYQQSVSARQAQATLAMDVLLKFARDGMAMRSKANHVSRNFVDTYGAERAWGIHDLADMAGSTAMGANWFWVRVAGDGRRGDSYACAGSTFDRVGIERVGGGDGLGARIA